jgi:glyoxylase-like metal-dependent hydrolase (beta-lactamase superfamily II)
MRYSVLPLRDGQRLGDGAVTTIVTGYFGPVAIGAYLFELSDGSVGLVDAGTDSTAMSIRAALTKIGKDTVDVRAIFFTHAHDDHAGGAKAFSGAQLYVLEPDLPAVQRILGLGSVPSPRFHGLQDGQRVDLSGTSVEVFEVPGHTVGSAAFLVHGVLFLGDSAAAAYNGTFQPNTLLGSDPSRTESSLRNLAMRLQSRRAEILDLAFGHQGALSGVDPLLRWADTTRSN